MYSLASAYGCGYIAKVIAEMVVESVMELFTPDRLTLAVIGPFEDEEKFKKLIEQ